MATKLEIRGKVAENLIAEIRKELPAHRIKSIEVDWKPIDVGSEYTEISVYPTIKVEMYESNPT